MFKEDCPSPGPCADRPSLGPCAYIDDDDDDEAAFDILLGGGGAAGNDVGFLSAMISKEPSSCFRVSMPDLQLPSRRLKVPSIWLTQMKNK